LQRLEATEHAAFAAHAPHALRLGKTGKVLRSRSSMSNSAPICRREPSAMRSMPGLAPGSGYRRRPRAPAPRRRRSGLRRSQVRWQCRAVHSMALAS
jgi:hypothetical protein